MTDDLTPPPPPPSAFEPPPPPPPAAFTPPPPPPPSAFPAYIAELPSATVQKKGLGTRSLAAVLGVVLIGGGLAFAVSQSAAGGAGTPEEAVQQLFDAISDEDIVGVLDVLPDGERRAFQEPVEDLSSELQRLGVLSDDFDLSDVGGIDLEFDDLDLGSEPLADGVSVVHLSGGSVTTAIAPDDLPIGDELSALIEELNGEPLEIEPSSDIDDLIDGPDSFDIVTVEEDGTWRVSLYYSIAEAARAGTDLPLPDFGHGISPNGQESPEAAVEAFLRAGVEDLDLEAMIALLPPDEMAALQDYAPLFLDDAAADIEDFATGYTGTINNVELTTDGDGGEALVTIDDLDVELAYQDDDGTTMTFDGQCAHFESEEYQDDECLDDLPIGSAGIADLDVPLRDDPPAVGILTVEVDGLWYISPTRTLLGGLVAGLGAFDDDALSAIPDMMDDVFGGLLGGTDCESFSSTGAEIDGSGEPLVGEDEAAVIDDVSGCGSPLEGFEETFDDVGSTDGTTTDDPTTSTTVVSGSDSPTTTSSVPAEGSATNEPSLEALTAMLVADQGFTAGEASCIAQGVYAAGFTPDQLLELQGGPVPEEIADDINGIVAACYSGAGSPTG